MEQHAIATLTHPLSWLTSAPPHPLHLPSSLASISAAHFILRHSIVRCIVYHLALIHSASNKRAKLTFGRPMNLWYPQPTSRRQGWQFYKYIDVNLYILIDSSCPIHKKKCFLKKCFYSSSDRRGGGRVQKLRENLHDTNELKFLKSLDIM